MKLKKKILLSLIIIFVFNSLGYINSYFGYQAYNKDIHRRFSKSIEVSKNREVFIKELKYQSTNKNIKIESVFMEKGYRWGEKSSKETQLINPSDTIAKNTPSLPFQVVVSFNDTQGLGKVSVFSGGKYNKYSPFIPILENKINDTLKFKALLNNKKVDTLLVWDK
ncbi:hypothetical protein [uncultured Aquimarina sp.]|uniref:hypothetical protein n=1 Tax=uncultured Aquimarina sp. TaxID=575652 RepID=UPI00262FD8B8|nr:hypothetical protein [uncultured Aquimarina sp.]